MTARSRKLLEHWSVELTDTAVILTGDMLRDADANMSVFSIADALANGVAPQELDDFLMRAYRHFSRALSKLATDAWFYAWHDEVSGTLRCSICRAFNATQLPFRCQVNVVGRPSAVSGAALGTLYGDGIPRDELVPETDWREGEAREGEFVLTVFALPLNG